MQSLPAGIEKGMKVYDNTDHHIGKVDDFRASDEDPAIPGSEVSGVSEVERGRPADLVSSLAATFAGDDDLPDELRERLLTEGYVRIDSDGLFSSDRYITPDQIASVSGDRLTLNVAKDQLIKRH